MVSAFKSIENPAIKISLKKRTPKTKKELNKYLEKKINTLIDEGYIPIFSYREESLIKYLGISEELFTYFRKIKILDKEMYDNRRRSKN